MNDSTATAAPFAEALARIRSAPSLDALVEIAAEFPVTANGRDGALYSGVVGDVRTSALVRELRDHSSLPFIDRTDRANFLSDPNVEVALERRARFLFKQEGMNPEQSETAARFFRYGDENAKTGPTTCENSLWGRASKEYVSSMRGDVHVIASEAPEDRIFGRVELRAALDNKNITSLGGIPTEKLRERVTRDGGDLTNVLNDVQNQFRHDLKLGVFRDDEGSVVLSREFAEKYHLRGEFQPAAELAISGLQRVTSREPIERIDPAPLEPTKTMPIEEIRGANLTRGLEHGAAILNVASFAYDAARVHGQYEKLAANGDYFAASAMVRSEALQAGGGLLVGIAGSAAAGAAWGAAGGAPTGPGAVITALAGGAVGGIVGAVGGETIARKITESEIDHQKGADGTTYAYKNGSWQREQFFHSDTAAPASQLAGLDYRRTAAITDLAIANPPQPDPNRIDITDAKTHQTRTYERRDGDAWQTHVPGARGGHTFVIDAKSDPGLVKQLDGLSAQRAFVGTHGAEMAANAFVTDYYGKGWDKAGPIPEAVTKTLKLPSETRIADPKSGITWNVQGDDASHEQRIHLGRGSIEETTHASGDQLKAILVLRDRAVATNHQYGAELIDRNFNEMERAAQQRSAPGPTKSSTGQHDAVRPEAVNSRISELRSHGISLPNVTALREYEARPQTGSFVHLDADTVAQHCGRGVYQICDVNRDLHGVTPPEGVTLDLAANGAITQAQTPVIGHSH